MKNYPTMKDINRKVVITVNDNVTLARIFDDNKVVAKGVAKCSPEDTFDFQMDAELAMKRAFESITKKEPTKQYRKLDRPPRPGDYIRLTRVDTNVRDNFDSVGDVLKISTCVMGGLIVGVHVNDHPKLVAHFKGVENIPFGNPHKLWMYGKLFEDYEFVEEVTE